MTAKLSPKQTALLAQIANNGFSFFDDGHVAGSGIWMNVLTREAGNAVAVNPRGAATVTSSLVKKGYLTSTGDENNEDGAWVALTEAGAAWITEYKAKATPVIQEELPTPEETPETAPVIQEAPATPAPAKKARKTKKAAAEAAPVIQDVPTAPEKAEEDPGYTIKEWAEDTADHGVEEYIETTFPDGSLTLRRRRKVSGAWRTDFWGVDAAGKRYFILSRDAKAARTAGAFTAPAE